MNASINRARAARRAALCLSTVLASGIAMPALAQSAPEIRRNNDEHGVDVVTGSLNRTILEGSIGNAAEGIKLYRHYTRASVKDNWSGELTLTGSAGSQVATLVFGSISEKFTQSGSAWINAKGNGATLTGDMTSGFTFKSSSGSVISYMPMASVIGESPVTSATDFVCGDATRCAIPTLITDPDGSKYSLTWQTPHTCFASTGDFVPIDESTTWSCNTIHRLTDVRSRSSYAVKIKYQSDGDPTGNAVPQTPWQTRTGAKFYDLSQVYCDPNALDCDSVTAAASVSYAYPSGGVTQVTDASGGTWQFTTDTGDGRLSAIRRPGASSNTTSVTYDTSNRVTSITDDGETKTYTWGTSGSNTTVDTSTSAGETDHFVSDPTIQQPVTSTNGTSNTVTSTYDSLGRKTRETRPEGDYTNYTYDSRGNVTETRIVAKSGSGLSDIVATASFDASCTNTATCNQPNYTVDPKGNRTDYTYDATHGGVTRVQMPAPTTGGTRPEVDYTYTALYPQVKNSAGTLVNADAPEYKVTQVTTCSTAATCAGTANETKVTFAYNTPNLQVSSVTAASGNGAISATTAYTYDANDNLKTVDGPLSGTDDTTTYFYDASNRKTGAIGPDPDGAGSRQRAAARFTYDTESRLTRTERGYTSAASDAGLAAMTVTDFTDVTYDTNGNVIQVAVKSGSTTYAVTQSSYDADNRVTCTAIRMNPAVFASLPSDACTASTLNTANGPDRITKNTYDANGRVTKVQKAYGQTEQADEGTMTYSANGQLATLKDAEANLTTYEYDGFDRLKKTRYPVTTAAANSSSATDYEQLTYDANSNVTQRRLRDGGTIDFAYDNLNRTTTITPSGEYAVTLQYDLSGHVTQMQRSSDSQTITQTYDALGRLTGETQPFGSASYQFDVAGRMTRLTWPDGLYVTYDYDIAGNVTAIRENGATSGIGVLATYSYDSLGRRTGITRGNGTSTSYAFDPLSRLSSTTQDLGGTTSDQTIGSIAYNPASQIQSQVKSNDAYAWAGHYNINRNYTVNGLNQQTAAGATSLGYDSRGNLTTSDSTAYTYNKLNQLTGTTGVTLTYDPAGRLDQIAGGSGTTRFAYAGPAMIGEYATTGTLLRRYVPGPGTDEPVTWYEGNGTTDRRWLHADERGSVIAVSDGSGAMLNINRYDEYGIPQSSNVGRFQYTGQAWLPELGMYSYKARMYSPTLGRFMQTDPIGYGDGINWYNYVRSDPINSTDPSGLFSACSVHHQWFINFRDYNHDGVPQLNEIVGGFDSFTAVCTDDGQGFGSSIIRSGDGGNGNADRCSGMETSRSGAPDATVDVARLYAVAAAKWFQHEWPLREDGGGQSTWGGMIKSPVDVANAATWAILTHSNEPAGGVNVRITANMGFVTGRDYRNGNQITTYITVILGPKIPNGNALPERRPISIHPGC